ncbi:hypothetical protein EDC04DRAFT_1277360 [Pisolithus marmoratus]|nr:hypothetical protein EDC04DRAFT_1277360 [Pisolithus marmoratus]
MHLLISVISQISSTTALRYMVFIRTNRRHRKVEGCVLGHRIDPVPVIVTSSASTEALSSQHWRLRNQEVKWRAPTIARPLM